MTRRLHGIALLLLLAGFGIWGVALNLFYGLHATGCAYGWDQVVLGPLSLLRTVLVGSYLLHLVAFAGLLGMQSALLRKVPAGDVRPVLVVGTWLTISALLASGFTALPVVVLRTCASGPIV